MLEVDMRDFLHKRDLCPPRIVRGIKDADACPVRKRPSKYASGPRVLASHEYLLRDVAAQLFTNGANIYESQPDLGSKSVGI
jgi:hypothetical protein